MRYADRLLLLRAGEVVDCASPCRVVTANMLKRYFGVLAEFATIGEGCQFPLLLGVAHDPCNAPDLWTPEISANGLVDIAKRLANSFCFSGISHFP
jgi:hypothetical protein